MTEQMQVVEPKVVIALRDGSLGLECGFCSGNGVEPESPLDDPNDRRVLVCDVCDGRGFVVLPADSEGAITCRVCTGDGQGSNEDGYFAGEHCIVCGGRGFLDLTEAVNEQRVQHDVWSLLHPAIREIARPRFDAEHYADAVEAAFKHFNARVKACVPSSARGDADGAPLMERVFSQRKPLIVLSTLDTQSGRDEQMGYMKMFAGAMSGVRNPKAHDNVEITPERALHHLVVASLFCFRLDEAFGHQGASESANG